MLTDDELAKADFDAKAHFETLGPDGSISLPNYFCYIFSKFGRFD